MLDCPVIDIVIAAQVLISLLIGWIRGGTREILSVIAWVGGIYLTISIFPHAREITRAHIGHRLIADSVTACTLFILILTALSLVNYFFSGLVQKSALRAPDRVLGGIFGIARGIVILAVANFVLDQYFSTETPAWLQNSRLRPIAKNTSYLIIFIMPEKVQTTILTHISQFQKQNLLDFVQSNLGIGAPQLENMSGNKVEAVANEARDADASPEDDVPVDEHAKTNTASKSQSNAAENNPRKGQTAEDLATLKPKKIENKQASERPQKATKKERFDMDRMLEQYSKDDED